MQKPLALIFCVTLLSACSKPHDSNLSHETAPASAADSASLPLESGLPEKITLDETANTTHATNPDVASQATTQGEQAHLASKAFIVKADVNFATKDVVVTKDSLEALALKTGGYIQTSRIYNHTTDTHQYPIGDGKLKVLTHFVRHGEMTVRIPKANVSEFLKGVQEQVVFLDNHAFNASDVALDLQRQALHAQIEAERQKKLDGLTATKTDDLADKTAHVDTLTESRYKEELARLDRQALAEQVAFSTITLTFYQNPQIFESIMPDTDAYIAKDERANFGHKLSQNIGQGWLYFLEFILWLVSLWAFVLGIIGLIVLYKKAIKPLWNKSFKASKHPKPSDSTALTPSSSDPEDSDNRSDNSRESQGN